MASLAEGEAVALSTRIYSGRLAVHLLPRCWGYWPASLCLCDVARGGVSVCQLLFPSCRTMLRQRLAVLLGAVPPIERFLLPV